MYMSNCLNCGKPVSGKRKYCNDGCAFSYYEFTKKNYQRKFKALCYEFVGMIPRDLFNKNFYKGETKDSDSGEYLYSYYCKECKCIHEYPWTKIYQDHYNKTYIEWKEKRIRGYSMIDNDGTVHGTPTGKYIDWPPKKQEDIEMINLMAWRPSVPLKRMKINR